MYLELRTESRPLPPRRRILLQRRGVVSNTYPPKAPRWSVDLWVDALSVEDVPERRALQLADGSVSHKSYFDVENGAFVAPGPPVIGWRWKHGSLGITDGYLPSIFPELTATPNGNGINATYQLAYQLTDGVYSFPAPTRFAVLHETSSTPLLLYLQLGTSIHPANAVAILLQRVEGDSVWTVARLAADSPEVRSGQRYLVFRDATSRETWDPMAPSETSYGKPASAPPLEGRTDPPSAPANIGFGPSAEQLTPAAPASPPAPLLPVTCRLVLIGFGAGSVSWSALLPDSGEVLPQPAGLSLRTASLSCWSGRADDGEGGGRQEPPPPDYVPVRVAAGSLLAPLLEASGVELVSVEDRRHLGKGSFATNDTELVRHWGVSFLGVRHLTLVDSVVENVPLSPYGALLECRSCGEVALRNVTVRHLSPPALPARAPGSGVGGDGTGGGSNAHYWRGAIALHNVTRAELDGFTCAYVTGAYNWACVLLDLQEVPGPDALRLIVSRSVLSHNVATSPPSGVWNRSSWFNAAVSAQPGCALAAVRGAMPRASHGVLSVRITDCDITNNTADGGPAFVTDFDYTDSMVIARTTIARNTAAAGDGGALHFAGDVGELRLTERTAVDYNMASMGGGAVYLSRMWHMALDGGSSLSYNTAAGSGGALLCSEYLARLTLLAGSAADGNTAGADGGFGMWDESFMPWFLFGTDSNSEDECYELSARNGTTIFIAGNSSISGNTAGGGGGGAISAYRILALHVTDGGRVDGNVASRGGSVLSVTTLLYANISGRGSSMSGNRATGGAAALAVSDYLVHELRVQDGGRADSNWAAVAPALLSCTAAGGIVVRDGGSVSNNTAEAPADGQGGGAVHLTRADSVLIAEGGTFSHNTVRGASGGALFVAERLQQLTVTGRGSTAAGNAAPGGHGGFLAAGSLGVLDVSDGGALANNTARDNGGAVAVTASIQAITIRGVGALVAGNTAQVGGAISVTQDVEGGVFVEDGASVEANLATARTGGFLSVGRVVQGTVRVAGGSHVCRCSAALSGGALFIQESVFGGVVVSDNATLCHNRAEGGPGGAVYAGFSIDSVLVARGGALEGNTAAAGPGGAVGAAGLLSSISVVDGGRVTSNSASGNGGAFYADFIGSLTLSGRACAASNRAGGDGGLAFASRLRSLSVADGSEVASNRASRSGGAVAALTPPDVVAVESSVLRGNVAEQGAGGVLSVAIPQAGSPLLSQVAPSGVVSVTLSDAEFIGNGAYLDGGALGFAGEAPSDPTGALSNLRAIALRIAVRGCNFSSNYAGGAGGALAVSSPAAGITTSDIQMYNSRFSANVAGNQQFRLGSSPSSGYGGAVFVMSSSKLRAAAVLSGARGAASAAATEDEDSGDGGSGSEGGGDDGEEDGEDEGEGKEDDEEEDGDCDGDDHGGKMKEEDGSNGQRGHDRRRLAAAAAAVVSLDSSCALRLRRVCFEDNRCQGSGGAVAAVSCPTLVEESTFEGNEARLSGGAVASMVESVVVEGAAASSPLPAAGGGAAALRRLQRRRRLHRTHQRRLLEGEASVEGNGDEDGLKAPWFEVVNSCFEENLALLDCGGGIYTEVAMGAESLVVGSVFEGNEAEESSGGAICVTARGDGAAAAIGGGSRLRDNTASRGGGGVYLDLSGGVGNVVELEGMRLRGNEAAEGGAVAVMAAAGSAAVLHGVTMESNAATADGGGLHILCAGAACGSEPLATLQRCNITANVAGGDTGGAGVVGRGGGLFVGAGGVAMVEDCNLVRNAAAAAGGGVAAVGCGALELFGGVVAGGAAGLQGGGVYTEACGSVLLRGAVLEGNRAATGGGAFFADAAVAAPAAAAVFSCSGRESRGTSPRHRRR
ncbi:hypothetical protein GPECTOR_25g367 [Gonium pectorale]|uniref:Right handed beta helix domain-containing protein n=1 Tax=Gonium pectorale TaxID=33097 RepID=A0A150GG68_GONPE|nr:hypothetical protein GPECTOR_25g367 [Gonium pectorale]|eukprot:KXZ48783.1 hypothetical protein GPECTOR_25g367 [Gonium pectorale]